MGRKREFDTERVLDRAGEVFARSGYHGASVDELLKATAIQRASLYQAFGSKRGLFLEVLRRSGTDDVVLVALMDLAADDDEIRRLVAELLRRRSEDPVSTLGQQLLRRGGLTDFLDKEDT